MSPMQRRADAGRFKRSKAERRERLTALRPLILARLCARAQTITHLMAAFDVYETEARVVVAALLREGLVTKIKHAGKYFYKGTL